MGMGAYLERKYEDGEFSDEGRGILEVVGGCVRVWEDAFGVDPGECGSGVECEVVGSSEKGIGDKS